ncbi:hypothetical protein BGZ80_006436 [Entomortierella chlamydospora]|uniref:RNase III domain-containing protein n=1 Tax=Entomortierella chlamydospora TaxID=101097 RepID=A0A9P6MZ60_9FUNG|nr:hypothetical protein BGZ80_006436 [Entomortierella chlamydospora]
MAKNKVKKLRQWLNHSPHFAKHDFAEIEVPEVKRRKEEIEVEAKVEAEVEVEVEVEVEAEASLIAEDQAGEGPEVAPETLDAALMKVGDIKARLPSMNEGDMTAEVSKRAGRTSVRGRARRIGFDYVVTVMELSYGKTASVPDDGLILFIKALSLCDAYESLIGAVYVESGLDIDAARTVFNNGIRRTMDEYLVNLWIYK